MLTLKTHNFEHVAMKVEAEKLNYAVIRLINNNMVNCTIFIVRPITSGQITPNFLKQTKKPIKINTGLVSRKLQANTIPLKI